MDKFIYLKYVCSIQITPIVQWSLWNHKTEIENAWNIILQYHRHISEHKEKYYPLPSKSPNFPSLYLQGNNPAWFD